MICNTILDAMGNTPIIRLQHMVGPDDAEVLVKFEGLNVGGSIKTRTALNMIEHAKIIIQAIKERKFSNAELGLDRIDYPENDEEEASKYLVVKLTEDGIKFERIPVRYWGNMKEQYEAHNPDYAGVYQAEN